MNDLPKINYISSEWVPPPLRFFRITTHLASGYASDAVRSERLSSGDCKMASFSKTVVNTVTLPSRCHLGKIACPKMPVVNSCKGFYNAEYSD